MLKQVIAEGIAGTLIENKLNVYQAIALHYGEEYCWMEDDHEFNAYLADYVELDENNEWKAKQDGS